MKYTNGWKYLWKDTNRFELKLRLGLLTVLELYADCSDRKWKVVLLNFGVGSK